MTCLPGMWSTSNPDVGSLRHTVPQPTQLRVFITRPYPCRSGLPPIIAPSNAPTAIPIVNPTAMLPRAAPSAIPTPTPIAMPTAMLLVRLFGPCEFVFILVSSRCLHVSAAEYQQRSSSAPDSCEFLLDSSR